MLSIEHFLKNGYTKLKFKDVKIIDRFKNKISNKINIRLNKINKKIKVQDLDKFHKLNLSDIENSFVFNSNHRNIKLSTFDIKEFFRINYLKAILEHYYGNQKPQILYAVNAAFKTVLN